MWSIFHKVRWGPVRVQQKYHSDHFFMLICYAFRIVDDSYDVSTSRELSAEKMVNEVGNV